MVLLLSSAMDACLLEEVLKVVKEVEDTAWIVGVEGWGVRASARRQDKGERVSHRVLRSLDAETRCNPNGATLSGSEVGVKCVMCKGVWVGREGNERHANAYVEHSSVG